MGNLRIKRMFKLAALAAAAAVPKDDDIPEEYQWAMDCDYENAPWAEMAHYHKLPKIAKASRDGCMLVTGHVYAISDVDVDIHLNRCECTYGCIAYEAHGKELDKDEFLEVAKKCVPIATEHIPEGKGVMLKDAAAKCAEDHPTLEGSPFKSESLLF